MKKGEWFKPCLPRILPRLELDERGCWNYTGPLGTIGYSRPLSCHGKYEMVHRIMWMLFRGPTEGLNVLHICDNRRCCNPEHLFLGTQSDNMNDMFAKGRCVRPRGIDNNCSILNEEQVKYIRSTKKSSYVLADELGVCKSTIGAVRTFITWRHVK